MAIQPIDLQTLFTQLDKVGKNQAMQREGQQIQESIQQMQIQKKNEQNIQSVNQAQDLGEEAGTIKDEKRHGGRENESGARERRQEDEEFPAAEERRELFRDPALGRNIDISG
jgi:MOSC domain-containing protein YiiM